MRFAERMSKLSSAIFTEMNERKKALMSRGREVFDLSIGAPDLPPAPHIIEALRREVSRPENYGYAIKDLPDLLEAAARWYKRRFEVDLDPGSQIISLVGSQDGLAHLALCLVNPGDVVLVPDPGYPIFTMGPYLAGAELYPVPQTESSGFIMDLDAVPKDVAERAKLIITSYPNNPVASIAPRSFYEKLVAFAQKYDVAVLHDNAYCELTFDGYQTGSFLQVPGSMEVGVEFNSLSKTYNMAGCRIGFALGNPEMIRQLAMLKSHIDYGIFTPIQKAGIAALEGPQEYVRTTAETYQRRRDLLIDGLEKLGWLIPKPKATMFVWASVPKTAGSSMEFTLDLMEKTGIVVVPGHSFGPQGEGYIRMALVQPENRLERALEAVERSWILRT